MLGQPFGYVLYGATLREGGDGTLELPAMHDYATRVVLYGVQPGAAKGVTAPVRWRGCDLQEWDHRRLLLDDVSALPFGNARPCGPAFLRGTFACDDPAGTFLDTGALGKGTLFVNGRNAGRYWNVGPQRRAFVRAAWLRRGRNEIVAFDLKPSAGATLHGCRQPRDGTA